MSPRTLLLDNYDSFTFNLFQLLAETNGVEPIVVRNDEATWAELTELPFDNIVVSPGPGRPDRTADFGVCRDAILHARVPLLGVCLGHQGIASFSGGEVVHAPEVMHGRLSRVHHHGSELFAGLPQGFAAVRYHSLCVAASLPDTLVATAWTPDGVVMGLAHRARPLWGVQFHPESICTQYGQRLMENFRDLTRERTSRPRPRPARRARIPEPRAPLKLVVERIDRLYDTERAFVGLYGDENHAFWLDSSRPGDERSRFSFMGAAGGPLGAFVTYDVGSREVTVTRDGETSVHRESIFDHLRRELERMRLGGDGLPFDFGGGFVGYFGYELKADCEGDAAHSSPLPDAAFLLADRLIAFDHLERRTYLVCVTTPAREAEARRWAGRTRRRLDALPRLSPPAAVGNGHPLEPHLSRPYEQYVRDIRRCHELLADGETYEVCLTNRITVDVSPDPLTAYRILRAVNPAPFSAFLRFGDTAVLSSSPERFLSVGRDRWVEAKPIKGTTRRGATPAEDRRLAEELRSSEKNRAENLMITDLLRNDLGLVCEIGSVDVPHLMAIETFETVHQLVSTVCGRLRADLAAPDCIQACFPGGSMTGAPKKRTMEIIDALEGEARGVYSGAIGYLGLGGAADLSIVIRTIVIDGESTSIGAGGAIVMQSDPDEEFEEMLLKAQAPLKALALCGGRVEHAVAHA